MIPNFATVVRLGPRRAGDPAALAPGRQRPERTATTACSRKLGTIAHAHRRVLISHEGIALNDKRDAFSPDSAKAIAEFKKSVADAAKAMAI